ncbi:MAG: thioredoxin family protein [Planctomycetota bacterium]
MVTPEILRAAFESALPYDAYIATGRPDQQSGWNAFHSRVRLNPEQRELIAGFSRRVNILVISGLWCGDCVQQCPILDHLARVLPAPAGNPDAPGVDLRFVDRDEHIELSNQVKICGGNRVPTVIFMNEEHEFLSLAGDRTLSRYRAMAGRKLGPSCPVPGAPLPIDEVSASTKDWLEEVEKAHLIVRLSAKLRAKHGD